MNIFKYIYYIQINNSIQFREIQLENVFRIYVFFPIEWNKFWKANA